MLDEWSVCRVGLEISCDRPNVKQEFKKSLSALCFDAVNATFDHVIPGKLKSPNKISGAFGNAVVTE